MSILFKFMAERKKEFVFCVILATLGSLLGIVPYAMIYYIIEFFMENGTATDPGPVINMLGIVFIVVVVKYIFVVASFVFSHIAAFSLLYDIRVRLAGHLGRLPMGYWSSNNSGMVRKVIHSDVESLENFMAHHVPDMVSGVVLPVATIGFLFFVDWRLALCTLIPLPIGIFMMQKMMGSGENSKRNQLMKKYHDSLEAMHSGTVEFVQGMPVVKVFNIVVASFTKLKTSLESYRDFVIMISKTQSKYWAVFSAIVLGGGVFILPAGLYLLENGKTDAATLILFLILGNGCFVGFVNLIMTTGHIERITEGLNRVQRILDEEPLSEPAIAVLPEDNGISMRNLSFRYGDNSPQVLNNINLEIPAGSFTAIVGPSGAGKTTLVHLMARMWEAPEGTISIGGIPLENIGTKGLNRTVGTVFQDVQMLTDTVKNNIVMSMKDVPFELVEEAARTAACYDFIQELPNGFDTVIGDGGDVHLSGGEKQRIALARVVLKNPAVVLLDEASSYADAENEAKMQEAFSAVTHGKTVVVIAHRLSTIVNADQIVVVDNGQIVEKGSHDELLGNKGVYSEMWKAHTRARHWKIGAKEAVNEC